MNLFNKSITSFEIQKYIHIRKYYKAIISTDESHASLKKIKLRQRPFENQGGGAWIFVLGQTIFVRALLEAIYFFSYAKRNFFF